MLKTIPAQMTYNDASSSRDTPWFILAVDTQVAFDYLGLTYHTLIPAGWGTDFGSVPASIRWLVPNMGIWDAAYVLHDWLYSADCPLKQLSRNDADLILRFKLIELGMSYWKANLVYWAVYYAGASHWRKVN